MREGVLSGEGALREVAAFLLDDKHFHRVPETFFAEVYHPHFEASGEAGESTKQQSMGLYDQGYFRDGVKYGSLQLLKENHGESCDYSSRKFPVEYSLVYPANFKE